MRDYGKALRYLRRNKDYTQQELADMLNVVPQTVSKWENGVNQLDMDSITSICSIFGISTDEFIRLADDDKLTESFTEENKTDNAAGGCVNNNSGAYNANETDNAGYNGQTADSAEINNPTVNDYTNNSADNSAVNNATVNNAAAYGYGYAQTSKPSEPTGFSGFIKKAGLHRFIIAIALVPVIFVLSLFSCAALLLGNGAVTVYFIRENDVFATAKCARGGKVTPPANTSIYNYEFEGWFADAEFTTSFDFNKPVKRDTRVFGKWTERKNYTVTYVSDGEVIATEKVSEGVSFTPKTDFYKTNYNFCGLYSDPGFTELVQGSVLLTHDITFYVKFLPVRCMVKLVEFGGRIREDDLYTTFTNQFALSTPLEYPLGYEFKGWKNGDKLYAAEDVVYIRDLLIENDTFVFTAEWEPYSYTVIYQVLSYEDGSVISEWSETRKSGERFMLDRPDSIPEGYNFMGWGWDGSEGVKTAGTVIDNADLGAYSSEDYTATVTLRAILEKQISYPDGHAAEPQKIAFCKNSQPVCYRKNYRV